MFELIVYYVMPNIMFFGGIYVISKLVEKSVEDYIQNFDEYQKILVDLKRKLV